MTINAINNLCADFTANAITADSITFDSGTNILSTYSTGTFTPVLEFGGGSTGITYSSQAGGYYKIGKIVFIKLNFVLTNKGSSTGNATITGLPFTSSSTSPYFIGNVGGNTANTSGGTQFFCELQNSSTTILLKNEGSSVNTDLTNTEFANTSYIRLEITYWTD